MSRRGVDEGRKFKHLSPMAWASLSLTVVAALGGLHCLVTASPDFVKPELKGPFLENVTPSPFQMQLVRSIPVSPPSYESATVTFDVVSEDLQTPGLEAVLLLDFRGFEVSSDQDPLKVLTIEPGHLDSPPRHIPPVEFVIPRSVAKGCHSVTLVVSHEFVKLFTRAIVPKCQVTKDCKGDVATVTWWYQVGVDATNPAPCSIPAQDAGVDSGLDAGAE
jgi:hypothetical protein